jgi:hypothetical protein
MRVLTGWVLFTVLVPGGAPARAQPPHRYAILANADTARDHKRNIARAYHTLRALGFHAEDIYVVSPHDWRAPTARSTPRYAPLPKSFTEVMRRLAAEVHAGDQLVFYGTGHGDTCSRGVYLALRRGGLFPAELRAQIERLPVNAIVVMDQCFSGGFADAFEGTTSRAIVVTDVDGEHETYCGFFAEAFWNAFLHPGSADKNRDGKISIREAFDAAIEVHKRELKDEPDVGTDGIYRSFNGLDDAFLN